MPAALDRRHAGLRGGDLEAVAGKIDVVRRVALPDREDHVDRFGEQLVAVLVEHAERLGVRRQRAGADAEDEAPLREMVEHRGVRGDQRRVRVRKIGGAGGELDRFGVADQRGEEDEAVGDVLGFFGQVLADERVVETQPVGEDDRLAVFLQRLRRRAVRRVQRHGEVTESQCSAPGAAAG